MTRLDDVLEEMTQLSDTSTIQDILNSIAQRYGLKTVAYLGTAGAAAPAARAEPYFAVTYSPAWIQRYRTQGYLAIDPAIQVGLRRLLPIDWQEFDCAGQAHARFFGEASEFGLGRRGLSFPVHGHAGDRALFSVTADMTRSEWSWARRTAFRQFPILATHLHSLILRFQGASHPQSRLSPREIECLRWTSEGKTVWECGIILGLSAHTVKCYLESARHKLGASSNTHAVALALKAGMLFHLP